MAKGQKSKRIMELIKQRQNMAHQTLEYAAEKHGYASIEYEKAISRVSMMDNLIKEIENEGLA